MVLIALAIVFVGLGALSLSKSDSDDSSETTTSAPSAVSPSGPATTTAAKPVDKTIPVRVYNNSDISGLAAKTKATVEAAGWTVTETGNYTETQLEKTTVYYGTSTGEKEAAASIADVLGVKSEQRLAGLKDSAPGVIVIVTGP
jgi:hypothetical protein